MSNESPDLERRVMQAVFQSIDTAIVEKFKGYNSPLDALLKNAIARNEVQLTALLDDAISLAIHTKSFKEELRDSFDKKLSKVLLSSFEGEIERRANKLREDPAFRAKITVAIDAAVKSSHP